MSKVYEALSDVEQEEALLELQWKVHELESRLHQAEQRTRATEDILKRISFDIETFFMEVDMGMKR